jgi:hypothetical protein
MKNDLFEAIADCLRKDAYVDCYCEYTIANYEGQYCPIKTSAYGGKPKNLVSVYFDKKLVCLYIPRVKTLSEFQKKYKFPALSLVPDKSTATVGKGYHCVFIDAVYFQPLLTGKDATNIRQFLISAVRESLAMRGLSKIGREKLLQAESLVKRPSLQVPNTPAVQVAKTSNGDPCPEFTKALYEGYRCARTEAKYNAPFFLEMLEDRFGYDTAVYLITQAKPSIGFTHLWERKRLDLTVEAYVLSPEWCKLFPRDVLLAAHRRLSEYKYIFPSNFWKPVQSPLPTLPTPPTPEASDMPEGPAERVKSTTYRILRDTELARRVKAMHNGCCQICGATIKLADGTNYSEAHHIQALGQPHNGPDVFGNIICVCPNHHAELDYRVIPLDLAKLIIVPGHTIDKKFVEYHNRVQART